jgi:hypothetical protein
MNHCLVKFEGSAIVYTAANVFWIGEYFANDPSVPGAAINPRYSLCIECICDGGFNELFLRKQLIDIANHFDFCSGPGNEDDPISLKTLAVSGLKHLFEDHILINQMTAKTISGYTA